MLASRADQSTKPVILVVDDDHGLESLVQALDGRYGADYPVIGERSGPAGLESLRELAARGREVALILSTQSSSRSGGGDFLWAAREIHPRARRGLVLQWGESRASREDIVRRLAHGQADYVITMPMSSPDERFHRAITESLDEWWRVRGAPFEVIRVIGDERSARSHEICDLLQRHDFAYGFYTADSDAGRALLDETGVGAERLPVIMVHRGPVLVDPSNVEVAEAVGARTRAGRGVYDLVIVGAGPAGLSAAVYAASEGLRTALIERRTMGGQAGMSSMIRNYLGFPRGISGAELASRALDQAILFGADMVYGGEAVSLRLDGDLRIVGLADGAEVSGRTVVIATGVSYRLLDVPSLEPFNGVGVFYGGAMSEARSLTGEPVFVVGGGNSAGQAALHLAKFASQVTMLVRSESLARSMSDYLVNDIDKNPNLDVRYGTEVVAGGGDGRLEWLALHDRRSGAVETVKAAALFVLIGGAPFTGWLPPSIARDDGGYVVTGPSCPDEACRCSGGSDRLLFETTIPGVFAIGDARHDSVKRVASAAGEGAVCVRLVHDYLASAAVGAPS